MKDTNFSEVLRELMDESGNNTVSLSKQTGIPNSRICDWLNHNISPYLMSLIKLADFFDCSIDYLVGLSDERKHMHKTCEMTFGNRLEELIAERGITKYRLAKDIGVQQNLVGRWVKGSGVTLSNLVALSEYFDCTIDYLAAR